VQIVDVLEETIPPSVLALGNFDGLHLGHRAVLARAKLMAESMHCPFGVLTLSPHPREVFQPSTPPFRLTHPSLQEAQLAALGVDVLLRLPFDTSLREMPAPDFVTKILVEQYHVRGVVCGADFCFGNRRLGNVSLLQKYNFPVDVVSPHGDVPYSASAIRAALRAGRVEEAAASLGNPWTVIGTVIHGAQQGRTIGVPTANIDWQAFPYLHPRYGVYAVEMALPDDPDSWLPAIANIGMRPTVAGNKVLLEVHALTAGGDWYGQKIQVRFLHFLRTEQKFDNFDALKTQIIEDIKKAKSFFKL
jgi:riboflavin kinase / FMN adenylyltransferase